MEEQSYDETSRNNIKNGVVDEEEANIVYASVVTSSFILPMILNATVELGIFDILNQEEQKGLSAYEITTRLPGQQAASASVLDRMLRLLASHSLLNCSIRSSDDEDGSVQRVYAIAPAGKLFLRDEPSLAGFLSFSHDQAIFDTRHYIKGALLEGGIPFKLAHGMSAFEYIKTNPTFSKSFNSAVSYHSSIITKKILDKYDGFAGISTLVDVGGGRGTTLHLIVSRYPHIKGINFDLPQVIKDAPSYDGVTHVGGDMFDEIPNGGDAILLKRTCHNWSDEKCLKLLKKCHAALDRSGGAGKVIIVESIVWEEGSGIGSSLNKLMEEKYVCHYDNIMLTQHEGKERTQREFNALAVEAGFSTFRLVCCVCAHWVMELTIA